MVQVIGLPLSLPQPPCTSPTCAILSALPVLQARRAQKARLSTWSIQTHWWVCAYNLDPFLRCFACRACWALGRKCRIGGPLLVCHARLNIASSNFQLQVGVAAQFGLKPVLDYGDPNLASMFDPVRRK